MIFSHTKKFRKTASITVEFSNNNFFRIFFPVKFAVFLAFKFGAFFRVFYRKRFDVAAADKKYFPLKFKVQRFRYYGITFTV